MLRAQMSQTVVPRGGTVTADVGITHRCLQSWPGPGLATLGGFVSAQGQSERSRVEGVRACGLSPPIQTQPKTGSLGPQHARRAGGVYVLGGMGRGDRGGQRRVHMGVTICLRMCECVNAWF